ncbi:MAG: hypothetical protein HON98_13610 [Chloroflexi bacterium]|jgi:uncharacterized protein|nr:hypothetical protein [Chloroflexota bacterium]MBT3671104.1 hypothetical protein [Chloroflexota bacterium]MBT4003316.1 hypothetical protein [Chloroflexota bacterium]MBT4304919.1 hypothetical protein [Chloroflexota bacterium]MBT4533993.1 hypothetical protein [Chloroflexota bacterium]
MPYIIDGHNLIPAISGISLDDLEDEKHLIQILQEFCQKSRKDVTVYFDRAASGHANAQSFGRLTARFVRADITADEAIMKHLRRLGREGRNWTVVSSDHEVQNAAKRSQARVVSSQEFANQLKQFSTDKKGGESPKISESEVDEWLTLFNEEEE